MLDKVVGIGTCSGADTDKFTKFKLTPVKGRIVKAPLIKECLANIECKVVDIVKNTTLSFSKQLRHTLTPRAKRNELFTPSVTVHLS